MAATATDKSGNSMWRVGLSSLLGTTMEFYDFLVYGTMAALVFGDIFFPEAGSSIVALLYSYATFAIGFFGRPIGGMIFGHYGDKLGRKLMLVVTMTVMGVATIAIGCLPTYAQVGVLSPILLIVCRLVQGLALGGEWGGAALMVMESAPDGKRGMWSSLTQMGASFGMILSTGMVALVTQLPNEAFMAWGWRVPFLFSVVLIVLALYVRSTLKESRVFEQMKEDKKEAKMPLIEVFKKQPGAVIKTAGIGATNNVSYYFVATIALSYGTTQLGFPRSTMVNALLVVSIVYLFTLPLFATLTDTFGRKKIIGLGIILVGLFAFPYFKMLETGNFFLIGLAMTLMLAVFQSMVYSSQAAFFPEQYDPRYRYTGASLSTNLATSIFGGTCPFIATALSGAAGGASWPMSLYLVCICTMSFICLYFTKETYKADVTEYQADKLEA